MLQAAGGAMASNRSERALGSGRAMGTSRSGRALSTSRTEASARFNELREAYEAEQARRVEAEKRVAKLRREMEVLATGFDHFAHIPREEDRISTERKRELSRLRAEQKHVDLEWERRRQLARAEAGNPV